MTNNVFSLYSSYYDLLYRDKDYVSEVRYISELLHRYGIINGSLLEFGSGTGKHGCLLAEKGFSVHGIERSPDMVSHTTLNSGFSCQVGDICTINLERTFNAVLSLFHVVSYQTDNSSIQQVFLNAAKHLDIGGIFIFDIWYTPAVYTMQPSVRIKRISDDQVSITRIAEPVIHYNDNIVDVNYTIYVQNQLTGELTSFQEKHPMRHFSIPEIDLFAKNAGLQRISAEEFLSGKFPGSDTWGVCFILKRL
jgi:SAM-dependent methyltransferase